MKIQVQQPSGEAKPVPSRLHLYIPSFYGGGAERVFVRLANFYADMGIETTLVVNVGTGPLRGLLSDNVTVRILGARGGAQILRKLVDFLRKERPEVVMSAMTGANAAALLARTLSGVPTRIIANERNQISGLMRHWPAPRRWIFLVLLRMLYPRADRITAVTEGVAHDLARLAGVSEKSIEIVHNPGPDEAEVEAAELAPVPHPWLAGDIPVIVAMGRLVPQKGFLVLLEAMAKASKSRSVRLIILGDGPQRAELVAASQRLGLSETVDFAGFTLKRLDYVSRAALFVLPSDTEGFPNVLVEALACDVRVVCTDFAGGGAWTVLGDHGREVIVPVGAADELAAKMLNELDRPVVEGTMAAMAKPFSIEKTGARFNEIIRSL